MKGYNGALKYYVLSHTVKSNLFCLLRTVCKSDVLIILGNTNLMMFVEANRVSNSFQSHVITTKDALHANERRSKVSFSIEMKFTLQI